MATLADELLNDFDDSGSEADENHDFLHDSANNSDAIADAPTESTPGMELDGDEEEVEDAEEELHTRKSRAEADIEHTADENETKARVEKMQLGGVSDVRSVAGLMKTLQPVLEVCVASLYLPCFLQW